MNAIPSSSSITPATLLILCAGQGSPHGTSSQAGLGPHGELLVDYSIHDALEAGFQKIVFVIRRHMALAFRARFAKRLAGRAEVAFACQEFDSLPEGFTPPNMRLRPYGTVHAMLSARDLIGGPFAIINADDYYGKEAFCLMKGALAAIGPAGEACMVGYSLKNTVSEYGHVTRGICRLDEAGNLKGIEETSWIIPQKDGGIIDLQTRRALDPKAMVSMNFWGFTPAIFPLAQARFEAYLNSLGPEALKDEYRLPVFIDRLIKENALKVTVMPTQAKWSGVTYQLERARVTGMLKVLHDTGVYPAIL